MEIVPLIVTIPHSGELVPAEASWLRGLEERILMYDVDRFVDRLYRPVLEKLKIPHEIAQIHRYVIDLNRLATDVDCTTVEGSTNPAGSFSRGLLWEITTDGHRLMKSPVTNEVYKDLIKKYFEPFHANVNTLYSQVRGLGAGVVFHIDAHSMPSRGTAQHRDPGQDRADIVVSDSQGKSCSKEFKDVVMKAYADAGFKVAYNWPYFGGRITEQYGAPDKGRQVVQVELNRRLYMDEATKKFLPENSKDVEERIERALTSIWNWVRINHLSFNKQESSKTN